MTRTFIELKAHEPFTIGGTRECYLHPTNTNKCIKVLRDDRTPEKRRRLVKGIKRFRRLKHWDDQYKEQTAYHQIAQRHGNMLWRHIPEFFGVVDTDKGLGIVTRVFRNFDGNFPLNLDQQIPLGIDEPLQFALVEFKAWLRKELVLTRDLLPHNIIAVRDSVQSCRLVIVDGIGNSEWIPVSSWFRFVARQKIERKLAKFESRIQLLQRQD